MGCIQRILKTIRILELIMNNNENHNNNNNENALRQWDTTLV